MYRTECQEIAFDDYDDLLTATRAAVALSAELGLPVRVRVIASLESDPVVAILLYTGLSADQ